MEPQLREVGLVLHGLNVAATFMYSILHSYPQQHFLREAYTKTHAEIDSKLRLNPAATSASMIIGVKLSEGE